MRLQTPPPEIVPLAFDETLLSEVRVPVHQTKQFYFSGRKGGADKLRSRILEQIQAMNLPQKLYENGVVLLDEIIANGQEHGCGFDSWKRFMVQALHTQSADSDYLQLSAQFPGEGFDARTVRLSQFNEDGSVYVGIRSRGHLFMKTIACSTSYFNNGKDLHTVIKYPDELHIDAA